MSDGSGWLLLAHRLEVTEPGRGGGLEGLTARERNRLEPFLGWIPENVLEALGDLPEREGLDP